MTVVPQPKERDLFSVRQKTPKLGSKKGKKTVSKKRKKPKDEESEEEEETIKTTHIPLSYENITEGQNILGCICEIRKYEMVISLPNRMHGSLPITSISSSYKKMLSKISYGEEISEKVFGLEDLYSVGQLIITKVKSLKVSDSNYVTIQLSILPEDVNSELRPSALKKGNLIQGAVLSTEENGFIIETGMKNVRAAFLSADKAPSGNVGIGSVFLCAVKKVSKDEDSCEVSLKLSSTTKRVVKSSVLMEDFNVETIIPGTIIEADIEYISRDGLGLSSSSFKGFVRRQNLKTPSDLISDYVVGMEVKARVLYIEKLTYTLVCTMNEKLCEESVLKEPLRGLKIGDVVKNCKVYYSSKEGVHLMLKNNYHGFCSGNKLHKDISKDKIEEKYPVNSTHTCKIIQVNLIDQLFIVSMKYSTLVDDEVSGKTNVNIGDKLSVKILEVNDYGAVVALNKTEKGFVPTMHMTDSSMKNPELKYAPGMSHKARVIKLSESGKPVLTMKSELINTKLQIISNFKDQNLGMNTVGCVVGVFPGGILLELFGNSKAFVSKSNIPSNMRDKLEEFFKHGMVLNCKIIYVDKVNRKMNASLIKDSENKQIFDDQKPKIKSLESADNKNKKSSKTHTVKKIKSRSFVDCEVSSVSDLNVHVIIAEANKKAVIPYYHLSDDDALSKVLIHHLKTGDKIKNAVVLGKRNSTYILSIKPLVCQFAKGSQAKEDIVEGQVFPSIVSSMLEDRISLSYLNQDLKTNIFVLKKKLCDIPIEKYIALVGNNKTERETSILKSEIQSLTLKGLQVGQTMFVKFELVKNDFPLFCTNLSEVMSNKEESSLQLLYNYLMSERLSREACKSSEVKHELLSFKIGDNVVGVVLFSSKFGSLVKITGSEVYGVVQSSHYDNGCQPNVNDTLELLVMHINYKYGVLELSNRVAFQNLNFKPDHSIKVGQKLSLEVLLAKKEFILGRSTTACKDQVIYLPSKRHINDFKGRHSFYEIGREYDIVIKYVEGSTIIGNLVEHSSSTELNLESELPEISFGKGAPSLPGEIFSVDENKLTKFLYREKCKNIILKVTQTMLRKRKGAVLSGDEKYAILMDDEFPQFDDEYFWDYVVAKRKERRKLKVTGKDTGRRKVSKSEISDRNVNMDETMEDEASENEGSDLEETWASETTNTSDDKLKRKKTVSGDDSEGRKRRKIGEHESPAGNKSQSLTLQVPKSGFDWSGKLFSSSQPETNDSSSESEEEDDDANKDKEQKAVKRLSKYEKSLKTKFEERKTRQLELERLDPDREPETALDYEEKIERTPHSASVWIEYISFHLENAETEKAKGVASRALKVIPPTLEDERLAVWNVILRLEVMYGTPESVQNAFKEAVVTNDELKIFYLMIDIYANASKVKEAEDVIRIMTKKYSKLKDVWIKGGLFYFNSSEVEEARKMLEKSLLSLSKRDQIDVISRFAQFEMKLGDPERAKTIFEKLLSNFPKRLDIWNVYADLLLKQGDIQGTRVVLERATGLKLKVMEMRNVFKKLLEFEKQHGTPQRVEAVQARVEEYVAAALNESET